MGVSESGRKAPEGSRSGACAGHGAGTVGVTAPLNPSVHRAVRACPGAEQSERCPQCPVASRLARDSATDSLPSLWVPFPGMNDGTSRQQVWKCTSLIGPGAPGVATTGCGAAAALSRAGGSRTAGRRSVLWVWVSGCPHSGRVPSTGVEAHSMTQPPITCVFFSLRL